MSTQNRSRDSRGDQSTGRSTRASPSTYPAVDRIEQAPPRPPAYDNIYEDRSEGQKVTDTKIEHVEKQRKINDRINTIAKDNDGIREELRLLRNSHPGSEHPNRQTLQGKNYKKGNIIQRFEFKAKERELEKKKKKNYDELKKLEEETKQLGKEHKALKQRARDK